jgi:hypothetical protein
VITPAQHLRTGYPDGDREHLDGEVFERNIGEVDRAAALAAQDERA